jgi:[phosphatase 2A protein]-leucine-carboxy methyltransferase
MFSQHELVCQFRFCALESVVTSFVHFAFNPTTTYSDIPEFSLRQFPLVSSVFTIMFGGDEAVVQTNDDATSCKRSAVRMGYWKDDFIESMMGDRTPKPTRRTPEIHRGYFARVQAFDELIHQFLQSIQSKNESNRLETPDMDDNGQLRCQIVNLGCGFDTLFWRLQAGPYAHLLSSFVDLDLPNVTCNKVRHIRASSRLMCALGEQVHFDQFEVHADNYHLVSADIRNLEQVRQSLLDKCRLDRSLPTVFLSECVLVYVPGQQVRDLVQFCTATFKQSLLIDYSQVNVFDKFGQVMVENLHFRGCDIKDLEACRDLNTQSLRSVIACLCRIRKNRLTDLIFCRPFVSCHTGTRTPDSAMFKLRPCFRSTTIV